MKKLTITAACIAALAVYTFAQQDKSKRPSPPANTNCTLSSGASITINYSSPRMRGRKIFGGLVPYGKVWRAGANEATTFVTTGDVTVGGKEVPKGNYTLFVLPEESKWTLIISKKTGEWGIPYPGESEDLARVDMKTARAPAPVEDFTIKLDNSSKACALVMEWENTSASVEIAGK
jgi:hypothetical protein